jgi:hypothetical protein
VNYFRRFFGLLSLLVYAPAGKVLAHFKTDWTSNEKKSRSPFRAHRKENTDAVMLPVLVVVAIVLFSRSLLRRKFITATTSEGESHENEGSVFPVSLAVLLFSVLGPPPGWADGDVNWTGH